MRFGAVPLSGAEGAILAHSVDTPGGRLRKGLCLGAADIAALAAAGLEEVIVARLDPGDVAEDAAAARIARALVPDPAGQGLTAGVAATGRVNLHAAGPGVIDLSPDAVAAMNRVHPMITLATVPAWQRVEAGTMVATIKIISYAVPEPALAKAEMVVRGAMRLRPPAYRTAHLIETAIAGKDPGQKGRLALEGRLDRLGLRLDDREVVAHRVADLTEALTRAGAEVIFVLTGSATSDPDDVGPAALRAAGGHVERFGMPVDPGNLLFLGHLGERPVIGLPGCARSPALNGADWVLERVLCGVPVTHDDIAAMGVGGLLKEIPTRPRPRGEIG
ncbi:MAG: molybdopterin-binding protein [Flavimaricola sp.]|nr:molybdopterin-binding protein [Flavimaricola sp.]